MIGLKFVICSWLCADVRSSFVREDLYIAVLETLCNDLNVGGIFAEILKFLNIPLQGIYMENQFSTRHMNVYK